MKKNVKRIVAMALMLCLALSLAGCQWLDDQRESQAFLIDGDIHWKGVVYKRLPGNDSFSPAWGDNLIDATDPDVPVLLSAGFAYIHARVSEDECFLEGDGYYCREDLYDTWSARMGETFNPQVLCFDYTTWDSEKSRVAEKIYTLTKGQEETIKTILETVGPMQIDDGWSLDYYDYLVLDSATEDLMFRRSAELDIARTGQHVYLIEYQHSETNTYAVPQEYEKVFAEIFEISYGKWDKELAPEIVISAPPVGGRS